MEKLRKTRRGKLKMRAHIWNMQPIFAGFPNAVSYKSGILDNDCGVSTRPDKGKNTKGNRLVYNIYY